MSSVTIPITCFSPAPGQTNPSLAASITRAASRQTYYTVRFLVDRDRVTDAFRAYAYFRWLDDTLDKETSSRAERMAMIQRQEALIEEGNRAGSPRGLSAEETLLLDLLRSDSSESSGLQAYIRNMMAVMRFDAGRRGRLVSGAELAAYTHRLAVAVTEALHYFIGHACHSPQSPNRYLAAKAAHIAHMLRDTREDLAAGYFNVPREVLAAHHIEVGDVEHAAYRTWVHGRVRLARDYFRAGRAYLAGVESLRCRLAGYAYTARFESVLDTIERDGYLLKSDYPERNPLSGGLRTSWSLVSSLFL